MPARVTPSAPRRVTPRIFLPEPPEPEEPEPDIGRCIWCDEQFTGPSAIRIWHGCVRQRKWGAEFIKLPYEDHDDFKWLCMTCAMDNNLVTDDLKRFSSRLEGLNTDGHCCLCKQVIEPYCGDPMGDWSSALLIELGEKTPSETRPISMYRPSATQRGHLHYHCPGLVGIDLWRMIESTDIPNYKRYLLSCG